MLKNLFATHRLRPRRQPVLTPRNRSRLRLEILEDRTLLSAGDLDPSFGVGGMVTTTLLGSLQPYGIGALAIQQDGEIIVAGSFQDKAPGFSLARYRTDGTLDQTFGQNGIVLTWLGPFSPNSSYGSATALTIQTDGRIVAGGIFQTGSVTDIVLVRYNADGSLDKSFGSGGTVFSHFSDNESLGGIVLQQDGKIVIDGSAGSTSNTSFVARYNPDASLDASFGSGGSVTSSFGSAGAVALQTDGKIITVGGASVGSSSELLVVRYNANGTLDGSFGSGGEVTTNPGNNMGATSVLVQLDGKIVVGGRGGIQYEDIPIGALVRYNPDGSLDPTFHSTGVANNAGGIASLALQSDGKIITAGAFSDPLAQGQLVRYTASGQVDTTFGSNGGVLLSSAGEVEVALEPDGHIAAAAYPTLVARLNTDGSFDSTFGSNGQQTVPAYMGPVLSEPDAVLLQPDGKIIVAGTMSGPTFALTRYNPDEAWTPASATVAESPQRPFSVAWTRFIPAPCFSRTVRLWWSAYQPRPPVARLWLPRCVLTRAAASTRALAGP
jgi:uncharacterized delta-60 repeat protein